MKYKRCVACDYWVTASDKRCPNCGIGDPRSEKPAGDTLAMETPMTDGTRAAFGGFIGAVIGGMLMDGMGVAVGVAVGVSLGVLLGSDRESWPAPADLANLGRTRAIDSLKHTEETIQQRLAEIEGREKRLAEAREQIARHMAAERQQKVLDAIDNASASIARQRDRYYIKLWEIELVRWQNGLEPLYADWESLTHEATIQRQRQLDNLRERGRQFLSDWEETDLADLPEAQRSLERLKSALDACDQLHEALLVKQAALAVQGIAPIEDALGAPLSSEALQQLDAFSARATLGEFSRAFDELEGEYTRLRSEEELAERANFIQRLGR